jgi:hypothetical protein
MNDNTMDTESMCLSGIEKKDLFVRLGNAEKEIAIVNNTIKVSLAVATVFMAVIMTMLAWWISSTLQNVTERLSAVESVSTQVSVNQNQIGAHIADPSNHRNNDQNVFELRVEQANLERRVQSVENGR